MKVICIEDKDIDGKLHPLLTLNKVYDVKLKDTVYIINGDHFMDKTSYKHFFVTLEQHRENQLNQILISNLVNYHCHQVSPHTFLRTLLISTLSVSV